MSKIDTDNNDTTVTEVNISKDQLETIKRILASNVLRAIKKERLLAQTGLKHLLRNYIKFCTSND